MSRSQSVLPKKGWRVEIPSSAGLENSRCRRLNSKPKILKKKNISGFIDSLLGGFRVFAPVKRDGRISFCPIESGDDVYLSDGPVRGTPKEILFPQSESLVRYRKTDRSLDIEDALAEEEAPGIIFGIHPCDAAGILVLDRVFGGAPGDPYYMKRREQTLLVGLGCVRPGNTCFCKAVGGSPFSIEGLDVLLIDIGEDYVLKTLSEKGEKLLKKVDLREASEAQVSRSGEVIWEARASMDDALDLKTLKEALDSLFDDPLWRDLSEKCLSCGICTYLCPTCHCFDMTDEGEKRSGERKRTWDSCQFPHFTLQASGENPRPTAKERYRQRIMHKFSFLPEDHRIVGCVGCGRCVTECPVNLDIRQLLQVVLRTEVRP